MTEKDTSPDRPSEGSTASEILPNFADLVVGMSRLQFALAGMAPFRNAKFNLTNWVALSVLAKGPAKNNRQLAKTLGVTRQRANQIKTSLEQARLVSATQSSEDARQNVLMVTDLGHALLENINSQILSVLASSLKTRERALVRANRSIRLLMRAVRAGKEAEPKAGLKRRKVARRRQVKRATRAGISS